MCVCVHVCAYIYTHTNYKWPWGFPGGSVVKNPPANILRFWTLSRNIPRSVEQLSLCTTTIKTVLGSPGTATIELMSNNYEAHMPLIICMCIYVCTHTHTHAVYLLGKECIQHNIQDKACLKSQELHPVWKFFSSLIVFQYQLQGFHHTQWEWAFQQLQCLLPTGNNHSLWVWQQRKFSWKLKIFKSHRDI